MSLNGDFTPLTFTNGSGQAINATVKNDEHDALGAADAELARSDSKKLSDYLNMFYETNMKEVEQFQDSSSWTASSATISDDTVNKRIGSNSIKILEPDNTGGWLGMSKTITSIDLTEFNDGSASDTSDFIVFVLYMQDYTAYDFIQFKLGDDNANNYSIIYQLTRNGWFYLETRKADFTTNGTPTGWDDITYINIEGYTYASNQNDYFSFQAIQLVRKDPNLPLFYAGPFQQYVGATSGWENVFTQYVFNALIYFDPVINALGFQNIDGNVLSYDHRSTKLYEDTYSFIGKFEMVAVSDGYTNPISWYYDSSNSLECLVEAGTFKIIEIAAGSTTTYSVALDNTLEEYERILIYFEKYGDQVRGILKKDGETQKILEFETDILTSIAAEVCVGYNGNNPGSLMTDFYISNHQGFKIDSWDTPRIKVKQTSQSKTSDTTMAEDDELYMYLPPNSLFEIEVVLQADSVSAIPDIKIDYSTSGNITQVVGRYAFSVPTNVTSVLDSNMKNSYWSALAFDASYGIDGTGNETIIRELMILKTGNAGGKISLRWAQNTSNASATFLQSGSYMKATKVKS